MDILNEVYYKSIAENERNLRFWDEYLQSLKSLDFNVYSDKLKVPVLVPIGSRILFRGEIKHTNEVTVALGADYFVKCSIKQAEILRQHRIKGAQEKFDTYSKEKEYLINQMSFTKQNIYENEGKEIVEYHTNEEDKAWREKHKQNVKEYMQKKGKEKENQKSKDDNMTDDELWNRLEELELQEELEDELNSMDDNSISLTRIRDENKPFIVKEEDIIQSKQPEVMSQEKDKVKAEKEMKNKKVTFQKVNAPEVTSKHDLLQKVLDRQNELDEKLLELKNRDRTPINTEKDLMSRLNELQQLDEIEDEMDRLDDIIDSEDTEESDDEQTSSSDSTTLQRRVSFVDEDNSETLNITFKHSLTEPSKEPYVSEKGIQKPSDIYEAHPNLFENGTTSILKKSKYALDDFEVPEARKSSSKDEKDVEKQTVSKEPIQENYESIGPQTIVIKDVVEKVEQDHNMKQTETKPMSLFKKKRMQNKM